MFKKKNLYLFCVLFTILTIGLSIFHFINGTIYDDLGYDHELFRAIFLFILLTTFYAIRHFKFNKLVDSLLSFWPLLLGLLLFLYLRYKAGDINFDTLKKWLLYILIGLLAILLISAIIATLIKYIKDNLSGKHKLYFSISGTVLLSLLVAPVLLWYLFKGEFILFRLMGTSWYLFGIPPLIFIVFCILLTRKFNTQIPILSYVLIFIYYCVFVIMYFSQVNIYAIEILQTIMCAAVLVYVLSNNLYNSVLFLIVLYILIFTGALIFFN